MWTRTTKVKLLLNVVLILGVSAAIVVAYGQGYANGYKQALTDEEHLVLHTRDYLYNKFRRRDR